MVGAGETATGGNQSDIVQAAIGYGTTFATAQSVTTGNDYLGTLSTIVGTGNATYTVINSLPDQMGKLSVSLASYNDAVASGDQGSINSAGLNVVSTVAAVLNTIGAMVAGIADGMAAAGMIGSAAAAPVISLGLSIQADACAPYAMENIVHTFCWQACGQLAHSATK